MLDVLLTVVVASVVGHILTMVFWKASCPVRDQHVFITGGSKGIGLAVAEEVLRRGARVTIAARNRDDLSKARASLAAACPASRGKIHTVAADTTSVDQLHAAAQSAEGALGPVDVVICNAGLSLPGLFSDSSLENFQRQADVNYLGTVKTIKAFLPGMLERRQGHICIISSALAICGFAGYSSYAPTKWALRGLADCLRNELAGTGVGMSIGYPPDTQTPGFASENELKPKLCLAANAALGSEVFPAEKVACSIVQGIERRAYHISSPDFGQTLLMDSMTSLSPKVLPLALSVLLAPVTNIVLSLLRWRMDRAVVKARQGGAS
ncbi:hypothetical protein ACKKBG_A21115 [Auxenochlorella protothecoides x Auxenochlorella symbiontica]